MACGECGIEFDVPDHFYRERKETGGDWYCPNGHIRVFRESDVEKLRRERDRLQQRIACVEDEKRAAEKQVARLKKRASSGTCPCCQRTFANMSRHMKHKHPEFVADNVVKLKAAK
jgi:chromosome segregation ATPase